MLSLIFCKVLSLFVICSKKRFCFLELWVIFMEVFAGIKSNLFLKKKTRIDLSLPLPLKCSASCRLKTAIPEKTWHNYFDLLYKYRLLCILPFTCVFRSNFFAWACYLVNISIKNNRCQNILFHETMKCDLSFLRSPTKKFKKIKNLYLFVKNISIEEEQKIYKTHVTKM